MMKKPAALLLAATLAASPLASNGALAAPEQEQKVIVIFDDKIDQKAIQGAEGEIVETVDQLPIAAVTLPADKVQQLKQDSDVVRVEKDILVHATAQTVDWGISAASIPAAWSNGFTGKGVKVAVVDTGIAPHPDLAVAGGASFVSYTTSYADDNGHGTHVAGIIGAENNGFGTVGAAPDADIYAVKSLGSNGSGNLSGIIAGIDWAITNKMDIVNVSLGTQTHSAAFQAIVDKAAASGILVVAAAGNDGAASGTGDTVDYPARYNSAIAVGAVDSSLNRASFSSTGSTVEVAAPGQSIVSTYLNNGFARMSGTSMAAPYAAGQLALMKQAEPEATSSQLRSLLGSTSKDLGVKGRDPLYGFGFIQAAGAVTARAEEEPVSAPAPAASPVLSRLSASVSSFYAVPGETKAVTVTAFYKDGQQADRTAEAVWTSSNPAVATVEGGVITVHQAGKAVIQAADGGKTAKVTVDATALRSLTANMTRALGKPGDTKTVQLAAVRADRTKTDVTAEAEWQSANPAVATVKAGVIAIQGYGKTTVTALYGGKTVKVAVDSSVLSLSVNKKKVSGKPGTVQTVAVTARLADGQKTDVTPLVTWKVSNKKVAAATKGAITISSHGKTYAALTFMGKSINIAVEGKK